MKERPTPETDAEHAKFAMGGFTLDFCRKLERERDEAREALSSIHRWIERNHADGFIDSLTYLQNLERVTDCWYDRIDKIERERDELREENNRLIELLRRDEKPIWMDGARSGAEAGIDMAIKCIESLRESILEKLKEEVK